MRVIARAILPPKTLERRNDIIKKTLNAVAALLTHFDRVGHSIEDSDSLLISSARRRLDHGGLGLTFKLVAYAFGVVVGQFFCFSLR